MQEINALKNAVALMSKKTGLPPVVDTGLAGEIATTKRGQGMDLVDIRSYQLGDDVKAIDWHTTARRGRPYIKVFEEESTVETCLFVQQDQGMLFATQGALKITIAAQCAAILTFNANKNNSPLAGICKRQNLEYFKASLSEQALFQWILDCSRGFRDPIESNLTLTESLRRLNQFVRFNTHIIVICDHLTNLSLDEKACFMQLRQQNNMTVIQIIDPIEVEIPKVGRVFVNIQGQGNRALNTNDDHIRDNYTKSQALDRTETQDFFKRIKVSYLYVFTHKNVLDQLAPVL